MQYHMQGSNFKLGLKKDVLLTPQGLAYDINFWFEGNCVNIYIGVWFEKPNLYILHILQKCVDYK